MEFHFYLLLGYLVIPAYLSQFVTAVSGNESCPVWTVPQVSNDGVFTCQCGDDVHDTVRCDSTTLDVYIASYSCMTFSKVFNRTVVGHCLYNMHSGTGLTRYYRQLPRLMDVNNTVMCNFTDSCFHIHHHNKKSTKCSRFNHQTALMCTSCVDGYAYPVYSYSMACVECKDYKHNWLKYIAVAFLPLTVFYIIVVLFRITATSGAMNGYILMCQILAMPYTARMALRAGINPIYLGIYFSFLGVWNLDFFRGIYPPFCLHPKLTTLETLMLDYAIAIYPLLLTILTYIFVKLHNRYSIVVKLWSPFYKCFAKLRNNWDINGSLVGAFVTFLLLSYVKILNASFYILLPNKFYDVEGNQMSKCYLFYDGTYEYFGKDHIPYALLAIFMLLVFNIFPLILLCFYPCRCFQRCLNYCKLQSLVLHIFMDTFNGCYKIEPRDYRYFAALYVFLRLLTHIFLWLTLGPTYLVFLSVVFTFMIILITATRPHKVPWHTNADAFFFASLVVACLAAFVLPWVAISVPEKYTHHLLMVMISPMVLFIPLYEVGFFMYFILPKKLGLKLKALFQHCKLILSKKNTQQTEEPLPYRFDHSDEYPPLLS